MAQELNMKMDCKAHVDSSAALGIAGRRGCGKMRHIKIGMLWIQEKAEEGILAYKKIDGPENPSDMTTKGLAQNSIDKHMQTIGQEPREGKAKLGLDV